MTPKISLVAVCCSSDSLSSLKQPHVLDGDHRLVGKGFEKLNLRRVKGRTSVRREVSIPTTFPC